MIKVTFLALSVLFVSQLCRADLSDDAEEALNGLRKTTVESLNAAFVEQNKIAAEVETAALDTKQGLQKKGGRDVSADDVDACVNDAASQAVDDLLARHYGVLDDALKVIYAEEKAIVLCGRSDENCLNEVIDDIGEKTVATPGIVDDALEAERSAANEQIELIKACAD